MKYFKLTVVLLALLLPACAQVPKEAVELSTTVGRDMSAMRKSHVELVDLYYWQIISDINKFIDDVYLPYQIQKTLSDEFWKTEMLALIESASQVDPTGNAQKESLEQIGIFLQVIKEEVEDYRKLKLKPVQDQYTTLLFNINQSYEQIHYANSIVTGHLASIVKVHDAQSEILKKLDVEDLRVTVGKEMADVSGNINELMLKAKNGEEKYDALITKFDALVASKKQ